MVTIGSNHYIVNPTIVRAKDLELLRQRKVQTYEEVYGKIVSSTTLEKVKKKIPASSIEKLIEEDISVLLYDASTTLSTREWSCSDGCDIVTDNATLYDVDLVNVAQFDGVLRVFADGQAIETASVKIKNKELVVLNNYSRTFAGLQMNVFRGDILITKQSYKHLENGWRTGYVLINQLPLDDYLK